MNGKTFELRNRTKYYLKYTKPGQSICFYRAFMNKLFKCKFIFIYDPIGLNIQHTNFSVYYIISIFPTVSKLVVITIFYYIRLLF